MSEIPDILNNARTHAWNEHISKRLEALRGLFTDEAWKALHAYFEIVKEQQVQHLIRGIDPKRDDFIRGRISMLNEILDLPDTIERQVELQQKASEKEESRKGGYTYA